MADLFTSSNGKSGSASLIFDQRTSPKNTGFVDRQGRIVRKPRIYINRGGSKCQERRRKHPPKKGPERRRHLPRRHPSRSEEATAQTTEGTVEVNENNPLRIPSRTNPRLWREPCHIQVLVEQIDYLMKIISAKAGDVVKSLGIRRLPFVRCLNSRRRPERRLG